MKINEIKASSIIDIFNKKKYTKSTATLNKIISTIGQPVTVESSLVDIYGSMIRIVNNRIIPFFNDKKYLKYKVNDKSMQNSKFSGYDILSMNDVSYKTSESLLFKQEAKESIKSYISLLSKTIASSAKYSTQSAIQSYFNSITNEVDLAKLYQVGYSSDINSIIKRMLYVTKTNNYFSSIYNISYAYSYKENRSVMDALYERGSYSDLFSEYERLFKIGSIENNLAKLSSYVSDYQSVHTKNISNFYSNMAEYYDAYIKGRFIDDSFKVLDGYALFLLSISYVREYLSYHYERSYGEKIEGPSLPEVSSSTQSEKQPYITVGKPYVNTPGNMSDVAVQLVTNSKETAPIKEAYFGGDTGTTVWKRGRGAVQEIANMQVTVLALLPTLLSDKQLTDYIKTKNGDVRIIDAIKPIFMSPIHKLEVGEPIPKTANINSSLTDGIFGFRTSALVKLFKLGCMQSTLIPKEYKSFSPEDVFGTPERAVIKYILQFLFPAFQKRLAASLEPNASPEEIKRVIDLTTKEVANFDLKKELTNSITNNTTTDKFSTEFAKDVLKSNDKETSMALADEVMKVNPDLASNKASKSFITDFITNIKDEDTAKNFTNAILNSKPSNINSQTNNFNNLLAED